MSADLADLDERKPIEVTWNDPPLDAQPSQQGSRGQIGAGWIARCRQIGRTLDDEEIEHLDLIAGAIERAEDAVVHGEAVYLWHLLMQRRADDWIDEYNAEDDPKRLARMRRAMDERIWGVASLKERLRRQEKEKRRNVVELAIERDKNRKRCE